MTSDELKKELDEKYETYLLIAQEEEFGETELFLNGYTMGIISLLKDAFEMYPELKSMIKRVIDDE